MSAKRKRSTGSSSAEPDLSEQAAQKLKTLEAEEAAQGAVRSVSDLALVGVQTVAELTPVDVMERIEQIAQQAVLKVLQGKGLSFEVPSRSSSNQMYVKEIDQIVLKSATSQRELFNVSSSRKTAIMTRVMHMVHEILGKSIHVTKRDLFYSDVKLFKDQKDSDGVLDDVACLAGCTRNSLHVVASEKGVVIGNLTFLDDGDFIDCSRMGMGGKAIPPFADRLSDLRSEAKFILLVEKDAAFMRLAEDRFYNKYPCIIITAKGQPDVGTRLFLRRLKMELKLPVLGLVDSDPYGLKILSVYMSGSKNMSYDSASLTTPRIKWLGVRPSDLDRYNIPEQCRLPMTKRDIETGKEMLKESFIQSNPEWHRELQLMLKMKVKAEIQALSNFGFQYLTEVYLPKKLAEGDWV